MLIYENLRVEPESGTVTYEGQIVRLRPQQYRLLLLFLKSPHRVFSYEAIIDHLWDETRLPTYSTIRSHIKGLRKALKEAKGADDDLVETVRGLGYRLKSPPKNEKGSQGEPIPPEAVLAKWLKSKALEYLRVDEQWRIKSLSPGLVNYCDYPEALAVGAVAQEAFPELSALAEIREILNNQESLPFEIKGIARARNPQRPEYLNLYVVGDTSVAGASWEGANLFVLFEDDSKNMIDRQRLIQQVNEVSLRLDLAKENLGNFHKICT
jgi:DNA-binding winged helix-turn-helix (wHTH) protein